MDQQFGLGELAAAGLGVGFVEGGLVGDVVLEARSGVGGWGIGQGAGVGLEGPVAR